VKPTRVLPLNENNERLASSMSALLFVSFAFLVLLLTRNEKQEIRNWI
jgi:hypothetical protein